MNVKERHPSPIVHLLRPELEELIENKNWHALKDVLSQWHPSDVADLFRQLDRKDCVIIITLLPPQLQAEVFAELDGQLQESILRNLADETIRSIIKNVDPDDRARLFEQLDPTLTRKLLNLLPPQDRKETLELLGYPKGTVGRLMTPHYVALKPQWTIQQAMEYVRQHGNDAETIDMIYVVADDWRLVGALPIRRLVLASPDQVVESIMEKQTVSVTAYTDQEEAIKIFEKYDLIALPVTDTEGHLLGIVTVDDTLDLLRQEQTEDFTKFSAIEPETVGIDYIARLKEIPITKIFRARVTWLVALLLMDLITGGIIQGFEQTIAKYVVLVTFLPVLVDTAGNAGSQSATLVIRALALGTVKARDWLSLLGRELFVGAALGTAMGLGISVMGVVRSGSLSIAMVVVLAMIINVILGCLIGVSLPFIFLKFKKDPATASTPLITTLADIFGTATYLGIAYIFLEAK